jgi:6-phosphogluconolactonase
MPDFRAFPDRAALFNAVTRDLLATLARSLVERKRARLALSGGSTPGELYRAIGLTPQPWKAITLALVDERWVPPDDKASNERLLRDCFAAGLAQGARFEPMKTAAATPGQAVADVERRYAPLRPFDLVLLGMGADGHTASWFPHAEGLAEALDPLGNASIAAVRAVGSAVAGAHVERMTLTRPAVVEAGRLILLIVGEDKRAAYEKALQPGPEADMPVRALLHRNAPLTVYWAP